VAVLVAIFINQIWISTGVGGSGKMNTCTNKAASSPSEFLAFYIA
jgi:hypothetical protein